jgi:hypothetical protein
MELDVILILGGVGAFAGLVGGFIAGADNLFGTILMGVIGGLALSAILRIAGAPPIYAVPNSDDFSIVWAAVGGLVLGFVVGRSNV